MAKTAILRFDAPDSCAKCPLRKQGYLYRPEFICAIADESVDGLYDIRAPFCPLEIQEDEDNE